jgi:hypothetical protein
MRLFFRGIYFPQMDKRAWLKLVAQNRRAILKLVREAAGKYHAARKRRASAASVVAGSHASINKEKAEIVREG